MTTGTEKQMFCNGNYDPIDADDVVAIGEGEDTKFVYDAEGNMVRVGDWVEVTHKNGNQDDWIGALVLVTGVRRGDVYHSRGVGVASVPRVEGVWAPSNSLNALDVVRDGRLQTSLRAGNVKLASVTDTDKLRLDLRAVNLDLARAYEQVARLDAVILAATRKRKDLLVQINVAEA